MKKKIKKKTVTLRVWQSGNIFLKEFELDLKQPVIDMDLFIEFKPDVTTYLAYPAKSLKK